MRREAHLQGCGHVDAGSADVHQLRDHIEDDNCHDGLNATGSPVQYPHHLVNAHVGRKLRFLQWVLCQESCC